MTETDAMSEDSGEAPRTQVAVATLLIVAGTLVLFVPAGHEGRVLVAVSEGHGLSAVDGAGAALLALGGTWLEVLVVRLMRHARW